MHAGRQSQIRQECNAIRTDRRHPSKSKTLSNVYDRNKGLTYFDNGSVGPTEWMEPGVGLKVSTIAVSGTTSVWSAAATIIPSRMASVREGHGENRAMPGVEEIEILPLSACMDRHTTSIPTPRPEMFDTVSAVEKPGKKSRLSISDSVRTASGEMSPLRAPSPEFVSDLIQRRHQKPQSQRGQNDGLRSISLWPSADLPAAKRASARSIHDRPRCGIMWVNGSARRSMTVLSTSVASPSVLSRTSFPVASQTSRIIRDILWKQGFHGLSAYSHHALLNLSRQLLQFIQPQHNGR